MKRNFLLLLIILFFSGEGYSQTAPSIGGFNCVTPGVPYNYVFNSSLDSTTQVQVCITGGLISGTSSNCKTGGGMNAVSVIWNDSINSGTITVNYAGKTITRNVNITPFLNGGNISNNIKTQFIDSTNLPADITCSQSSGGICDPDYSYQWQASRDILNWKDIAGAKTRNLKFTSPVPRALYFRRRTKENHTGTIAYSDVAVVFVN
jgi:hypothetical protein